MTVPSAAKDTGKKGELIQLRVEKSFLDQLNAIAEKKHLPLSAMVRLWLSDRVSEELKMINAERTSWESTRFQQIKDVLGSFQPGPVLVVHAHPMTPGILIDVNKVERHASLLLPWGYTGVSGRIRQHGYELIREHNGIVHGKGQIFKSGQIEGMFSVSAKNREILGMALDDGIVQIISAYSHLLKTQETPLPYLFKFSLLNAKGYSITVYETIASTTTPSTFEQDRIELSDIIVSDLAQVASEAAIGNHIRSVIDELWHAAGERGSASYNDADEWKVRR
jgi:hypothetical protein